MTKTIVITGSTKGIGYGLAEEFLKRGHNVVVSGRKQEAIDKAVGTLSTQYKDHIAGCLCDVTHYEDNEKLFAFAKKKFGHVDIWINNAGLSMVRKKLWEQPVDRIKEVVDSNLTGMIYGSRAAIKGMLEQGGGQLYNMEGFGSNDRIADGISVYGSTKRALTYFTEALILETKGTPAQVCLLSPGMVVTDLLIQDYDGMPEEWEKVKRIFNILADKVETVTPPLVERMLANKDGKKVEWLTSSKAFFRFMTASFNKRDLFKE